MAQLRNVIARGIVPKQSRSCRWKPGAGCSGSPRRQEPPRDDDGRQLPPRRVRFAWRKPTISLSWKDEPDLERRIFGAVGAMHRIPLDIFGKFLATVPGAALAGLVAPMISRFFATAFSPSRTCTTMGPEVMNATRSLKNGRSLCTEYNMCCVGLAPAHALLRDDAKPALLELGDNLSGKVPGGCVRFDNGGGVQRPWDRLCWLNRFRTGWK